MWWQTLLGVAAGVGLLYLALVGLLWHTYRRDTNRPLLRESLRLLPDLLRLLRRLAGDPNLPRGVRIRLGLLIIYLARPIDLIPDFIPVLGYADDALIVAIALRSAARHAGPAAIDRHWPGTPEGLRVIYRLAKDGRAINDLHELPDDAWISFLVRHGRLVPVTRDTVLQTADEALVLADPKLHDQLSRLFEGPAGN